MIVRIEIQSGDDSIYTFQTMYMGQELDFDGPFSSLEDALHKAVDNLDDDKIIGIEVAYQGLICGTYTAHALQVSARSIAAHALETWENILHQ